MEVGLGKRAAVALSSAATCLASATLPAAAIETTPSSQQSRSSDARQENSPEEKIQPEQLLVKMFAEHLATGLDPTEKEAIATVLESKEAVDQSHEVSSEQVRSASRFKLEIWNKLAEILLNEKALRPVLHTQLSEAALHWRNSGVAEKNGMHFEPWYKQVIAPHISECREDTPARVSFSATSIAINHLQDSYLESAERSATIGEDFFTGTASLAERHQLAQQVWLESMQTSVDGTEHLLQAVMLSQEGALKINEVLVSEMKQRYSELDQADPLSLERLHAEISVLSRLLEALLFDPSPDVPSIVDLFNLLPADWPAQK